MTTFVACPCGRADAKKRPVAYADCCGRFVDHLDTTPAPDAEHLMRSRYTAFVLARSLYLLATWHSSTRPTSLDLDVGVKWLGLEVRQHQAVGAEAAEVEFVARYRLEGRVSDRSTGRAVRLHEHSRFVREDGRWFYVDGDQR